MGHRGAWGAGAAALLLGLVAGQGGALGTARADDGPAPAADKPAEETPAQAYARVEATTKAHLRDKDLDALKADCNLLLEQGRNCPEVVLRPKYLNLIGGILQACRDDDVRKAAIHAIGEAKEPSLFKYLRPHVALPDPKHAGPLLLPAIEATGQVAADDGALLLIGLVKDAKLMEVAQAAMKALAGFSSNKRIRGRVVSELVATVRKDRPGIGQRPDYSSGEMVPTGRIRTGDDQISRWQALSPVLVETLNKMTGQNVGTAEDWFDLFDRYKAQPSILFPSDAGAKEEKGKAK